MTITKEVQKLIENFQPDYVFTYQVLNLPPGQNESVIKMLKEIPDTTIISHANVLLPLSRNQRTKKQVNYLYLQKKYPPMTCALFGVMAENIYRTNKAVSLWNKLNPLTTDKNRD